jgi:ADP-ribosylation factor GTPase-activating protein 2/3
MWDDSEWECNDWDLEWLQTRQKQPLDQSDLLQVISPLQKLIPAEPEETYARNKFSSQKGISSDQYFGRGAYDPAAESEARTRLQQFDGATAISSNQYFGREEEDEPTSPGGTNYPELEANAREFARRFMNTSGDDIQNIKEALGQGAQKLQDYLQKYG